MPPNTHTHTQDITKAKVTSRLKSVHPEKGPYTVITSGIRSFIVLILNVHEKLRILKQNKNQKVKKKLKENNNREE